MADNRIVQKFPTGEVRVFESDGDEAPVCVEHMRAPGDKVKTNLKGKRIEEMPAPFEPKPENE
ncbi:MAG: hypothetical protein Q7V31_16010 [Parvibaculum sp.]|uniref:hypothetical protein n=1 Tax=Parvibaculum sp. TaxID=2024848 RepID=UPI00271676FF|nr:hypothetical protein [Parvibaculum sp.]MDO8840418.1 hypothetical protein [Parvibaculum sp.]